MKVFYAVFTLFVPLLMILCGVIMKKYHSDEPNGTLGYRTKRSMKNKDTWKFANEYAGKLWIKSGIIVTLISALLSIEYFRISENAGLGLMCFILIIQSALMIATIYPVEKALKEKFDDEGIQK